MDEHHNLIENLKVYSSIPHPAFKFQEEKKEKMKRSSSKKIEKVDDNVLDDYF
jgi:hypothetical protein